MMMDRSSGGTSIRSSGGGASFSVADAEEAEAGRWKTARSSSVMARPSAASPSLKPAASV